RSRVLVKVGNGGQSGIPIASRSGGRRCVFLGSRRLRDPKAWVLTHPVRRVRSRVLVKVGNGGRGGIPIASRSGGRRCVFLGSRCLRDPKAWVLTHPVRRVRSRVLVKVGNGGQGGIRTHGNLSATHGFQPCSLNHSDTCPLEWEPRTLP